MDNLSPIKKIRIALRNDDRPVRRIADLIGVNATRMHRICSQGAELKESEIEKLLEFYQIESRSCDEKLRAQQIISEAHQEAREIRLSAYSAGVRDFSNDQEEFVAKKYGISKDLLRWRLADPVMRTK